MLCVLLSVLCVLLSVVIFGFSFLSKALGGDEGRGLLGSQVGFVANLQDNANVYQEDSEALARISENYSDMQMQMANLNSKIAVIVEPSSHHAISSGHGKKELTLQYLPENHTVQSGNKIYTSGKEGIFPTGIPIGVVKTSTSKKVEVSLFSDLNQITFINVDLGNLGIFEI